MSLRVRLLLVTGALAMVGLVLAGVATYASLRAFLVSRVDDQLDASIQPIVQTLDTNLLTWGVPRTAQGYVPIGTLVEIRRLDGSLLVDPLVVRAQGGEVPAAPRLPGELGVSPAAPVRYFTFDPGGGLSKYRVRAELARNQQWTLAIAAPIDDVEATLRRLVTIEVIVVSLALAGIVIASSSAIVVSLRPLKRIEATARAVNAGDLSQRVDVGTDRGEVGQVAAAFNSMLATIERSFSEKEASEQRLRRFVADASHELRTPLTSIRAHAELFRRGAAERPEDLALVMRRIEDEAARMGVLVEDLLLLARLDQGRPLERAPVDLARVAADAVADARAVEPERPVALSVDGPVFVAGDDARLRQVAANLLANVRAHTPPGAPATVRVAAEDGWAVLEVLDSGPGLDPDDQARVFERFYRADSSRTRATGGAGLGLSIVAAIAAAHGGTASVRSEPGRGAAFTVRLPLAVPSSPERAAHHEPVPA